ncbi:MAG: hypothetical protein D8M58_17940 [Calditrichaeota bacterium]|nr:MAG: hypothetical protein DWQ03_01855 [Calditrichota bacterium]MBL1207290.1 hypothetical protein [Calditrichota bacterium]NOG47122.1 hypothetical protein [Calditrichota bacterium]
MKKYIGFQLITCIIFFAGTLSESTAQIIDNIDHQRVRDGSKSQIDNVIIFIRHGRNQNIKPWNIAPGSVETICNTLADFFKTEKKNYPNLKEGRIKVFYISPEFERDLKIDQKTWTNRFSKTAKAIENAAKNYSSREIDFTRLNLPAATSYEGFKSWYCPQHSLISDACNNNIKVIEQNDAISHLKQRINSTTHPISIYILARSLSIGLSNRLVEHSTGRTKKVKENLKESLNNTKDDDFYNYYWLINRNKIAWENMSRVPISESSQGKCENISYNDNFKDELKKRSIFIGRYFAVSIAGSNDHVYFWWPNGTVSSGTTDNPTYYNSFYSGNLPQNKTLLSVSIAGSNDHVYYWWTDGTVSSGTTDNPTYYNTYYSANLPQNKLLISTGIAGSNDRVYYWWSDGTVSSGTTNNPTYYITYYSGNLPLDKILVGVGIAGSNDHVYYWWSDSTVSSGSTDNPTKYSTYYRANLPNTNVPSTPSGLKITR